MGWRVMAVACWPFSHVLAADSRSRPPPAGVTRVRFGLGIHLPV